MRESPLDTTKPHPARMYDYYLGGKDNFAADRETAEKGMASWPGVAISARANRAFLGRSVRHLADIGIRQFLDVGAGLPTAENVHQVAQRVAPDSRVVYVDNDPIVLLHARSLLTSTPEGRTAYVQADLHDPAGILAGAGETLDLSQPVAIMMMAVLHFVEDAEDPRGIVTTLMDAVPAGSHLVASHITTEYDPVGVGGLVDAYHAGGIRGQARTRDEFAAVAFDGMDLLEPGVVVISDWRPDDSPRPPAKAVSAYGGVARKP